MGGYTPPRPGSGSGVSSVTATAPLHSSGGATPNLTADIATTGAVGTVKPDGTSITIDGAGTISAAAGAVLVARVVLSAANLAAINATPVTAIAAPGAGKAIKLVSSGAVEAKAGTTPISLYSGALSLHAYYGDSSGVSAAASDIIDSGLINADRFAPLEFTAAAPGGATTSFANKALVLLAAPGSQGRITASVLGAGGLLYAPGDTFTVDGNVGDAAGVVDTVGAGGAVLTYHLTAQGTAYVVGDANATTATTGIGTGLTLDITAIQTVSGGDGSVTITLPYIVVDL